MARKHSPRMATASPPPDFLRRRGRESRDEVDGTLGITGTEDGTATVCWGSGVVGDAVGDSGGGVAGVPLACEIDGIRSCSEQRGQRPRFPAAASLTRIVDVQ